MFSTIAVTAQTQSKQLIQDPSELAQNIDSIYGKAAAKKALKVMYYRMDEGKPVLNAYANISNNGKVMFTNWISIYFERVYYSFSDYGMSVRSLKAATDNYPPNGDIIVKDELYDLNGQLTNCYTKVTKATYDTLGKSKEGWSYKRKNGLPVEKNYTNGETDFYTYDSHGILTEIKRPDPYDTEKYSRTYLGNNLIETNCTIKYSTFLLEKFEYNAKGLVSKSSFFDLFGNVTSDTYEYDAANRLIKRSNERGYHKFTYDKEGRLVKDESFENKLNYPSYTTNFLYNPQGLLSSVESKKNTDAAFSVTKTYSYTLGE